MPADAPATPPLSPDEASDARELFESELQADHDERVAKVARREARAQRKGSTREREQRHAALNALKAQVQADFYKKNGYKLYTDSTGRQHWLTPDEFAYRTARRKNRRHRVVEPIIVDRTRNILFTVGMVLVAIILGFALAR
jgi:hypothetical protein